MVGRKRWRKGKKKVILSGHGGLSALYRVKFSRLDASESEVERPFTAQVL